MLKQIKIVLAEERREDAWFDFGMRQLRVGEVRFYRVTDFLTGKWLFKVCSDREMGRVTVKAIKCPPGRLFAQLEGDTMIFQKSILEGLLYDVISFTYVDDEGRVRRQIAKSVEEVPDIIRRNFEVKPYEEATGREAPGKRVVALCSEDDEKGMIALFLLERAWPLSPVPPDEKAKSLNLLALIKKLEKASVEEIRRAAAESFELTADEVDALLSSLEEEGKIRRLDGEYVKVVG
ncbi:MAG: hypothetical protein ACXQTQ_02270 [Candidatus Hecatellaceae archaeon]